jgi:mono/diheme cytochrome c family protein
MTLLLAAFLVDSAQAGHREGHVDVTVPQLSEMAALGQTAFNESCAQCHGENGAGTEKGPPLVHPIYNPGHHDDQSIYNAMRNGVRQHHWPYGDMPKQAGVGFTRLRRSSDSFEKCRMPTASSISSITDSASSSPAHGRRKT